MRLEHVGRFGFWVPDAPVAAEVALQAAVPILLEDEYQLRELRRAGHWPQWIVDVGGHCGAFGLAAVDLFPGANLLAVEPHAESARCYRVNLGERACQLHLIAAAAVGLDSGDPIELCIAQRTTANWLDGLWEPLPEDACQRQIQVPARRLSSCLAEAGFPRVDLLKLDCEGAEVAVLEDLAETGWLERVRWLRLEWHGQQNLARVACLLAPTHVFAAHCDSPSIVTKRVAFGELIARPRNRPVHWLTPKRRESLLSDFCVYRFSRKGLRRFPRLAETPWARGDTRRRAG